MKIMVMGHGAVGSVLCEMFLKERKIKSIICVEKTISHLRRKGKLHFKEADLSDKKQISNILKKEKPNLVINASLPLFNRTLLDACLKKRANYMDLASYWDFDKNPRSKSPYKVEQLDFNERFRKKRLIGLINTGASPGITNLLAKECVDLFDKNEIDSIKIRLYEDTKTSGPYFPWSVEWLLDEVNWKPLVYRNGKFKVMENFSEEEIYDFPEHLGNRKVALAAQDEVGTIPLFIKARNVDLKIFDNQADMAKFLKELGLVSEDKAIEEKYGVTALEFVSNILKMKQEDFAKMKVPDNAQFAFVVEAEGIKNGKKRTAGFYAIFPRQKEIKRLGLKANFISYPTAFAAKTFALKIPKIRRYGVFPPEALDKEIRHEIINELKKHVKIREFVRKR